MKMDKKNIAIIVLVVLLVGTFVWIGVGRYNDNQFEMKQGVFQEGAQYGYERAIVEIVSMAVSCEEVPLRVENQTVNMIAVGCLKSQE